jgi:multisubunit Na+/H+ antiporter MnhB subunit
MTRVATLLGRLIREVKKHMDAVIVAIAIFLMTFGFYTIAEQPQYKIWGAASVVMGIVVWLIAYLRSYWREKTERQERIKEQARHEAEWLVERTESRNLLTAILLELKKLNQSKDTPKND